MVPAYAFTSASHCPASPAAGGFPPFATGQAPLVALSDALLAIEASVDATVEPRNSPPPLQQESPRAVPRHTSTRRWLDS